MRTSHAPEGSDQENYWRLSIYNKCDLNNFLYVSYRTDTSLLQITINFMLIVFLKLDQTWIILDVRSYLYDHQHLKEK